MTADTGDTVIDTVAAVLVVLGGALSVAAGVGLLRFRDPLTRLHAATKPQILGLLVVLIAVALMQRSFLTLFALLPIFVLQALTAPVSAHMVGRAAYRAEHVDRTRLTADELAPVVLEAEQLDTQWPVRADDRGRRVDAEAESPDGEAPDGEAEAATVTAQSPDAADAADAPDDTDGTDGTEGTDAADAADAPAGSGGVGGTDGADAADGPGESDTGADRAAAADAAAQTPTAEAPAAEAAAAPATDPSEDAEPPAGADPTEA